MFSRYSSPSTTSMPRRLVLVHRRAAACLFPRYDTCPVPLATLSSDRRKVVHELREPRHSTLEPQLLQKRGSRNCRLSLHPERHLRLLPIHGLPLVHGKAVPVAQNTGTRPSSDPRTLASLSGVQAVF